MKLLYSLLVILLSVACTLSSGVYKVNVKETNLNIRKEANTKSDIVGKLKKGQYIYATSESNGWAEFYKGYCSMDYLVKVSNGTEYTTNGNLNFRTGPSPDYKIITTLKKGINVTYFGNDPFTSNWAVTSEGYANAEYLNMGDNASSSTGAGVYRVNVKETNLNIRKEPTTESDIIGKLKKGQYIYATSVSNGWAKFYKGYCSMDYLVKENDGTKSVTNGNLNFRTGPSPDYKIITTLKKGTNVSYFDNDPFTINWAITSEGYANVEYLIIGDNTSSSTGAGVYRVNVKETDLDIREDANTKSDIVGKLKNGQYIYATAVSNGWAKFYKGHCSIDYLVKVNNGTECATNGNLNFRAGPSTDYKIITTLKKGVKLTYFDSDPFTTNWAVTSEGYANSKYLNIEEGKQSTTTNNTSISTGAGVYRVNVKETDLNIRKEANTKSDVVGKLKKGQYIYATSVSDGWAKFYKGHCSMDYLVKENDDPDTVTDANKFVTNTTVNFKVGPSDDYETITTLNNGTSVIYYDIDPFTLDWAVTSKGYANMQYLNNAGEQGITNDGQSNNSTLIPANSEQFTNSTLIPADSEQFTNSTLIPADSELSDSEQSDSDIILIPEDSEQSDSDIALIPEDSEQSDSDIALIPEDSEQSESDITLIPEDSE